MTTITETQSLVSPETYRGYVDRLSLIVDSFENSTDFLSGRLRTWALEVLQLESIHASDSLETINRIANEKLKELTETILIDPLLNRPLQDPVIERTWVLERPVHGDLRKYFPEGSPLDGEAMAENPPPHFFALAMIVFVKSVNPQLRRTENQISPFRNDPSVEATCRGIYSKLAQDAVRKRRQQETQDKIRLISASNNQLMLEIYRQDAEALGAVALSTAEHEAVVVRRLNSITQVYQSVIDGINEHITFMEETHRTRVANLEKEIKAIEQTTGVIQKATRAQLADYHATHQREIAIKKGQIDSLVQEMQRSDARHQNEMSAMGSQISQISQKADQAIQQLSSAVQKTREQEKTIQHQHQEIGGMQWQIRRLQEELDDQSSSCIIS